MISKDLIAASSRPLILSLLSKKESYGYEIIKNIQELSQNQITWKDGTLYPVLKKLCEKGIFQNENAVVSSLISKDEYYANQSIRFVEDTFGGSLPKFLTSFISGKKLSNNQAEELKRLIDEHKEV